MKGYQAKGDEKRQGEGGGHKIGKLGGRRLWMGPKVGMNLTLKYIIYFQKKTKSALTSVVACTKKLIYKQKNN